MTKLTIAFITNLVLIGASIYNVDQVITIFNVLITVILIIWLLATILIPVASRNSLEKLQEGFEKHSFGNSLLVASVYLITAAYINNVYGGVAIFIMIGLQALNRHLTYKFLTK